MLDTEGNAARVLVVATLLLLLSLLALTIVPDGQLRAAPLAYVMLIGWGGGEAGPGGGGYANCIAGLQKGLKRLAPKKEREGEKKRRKKVARGPEAEVEAARAEEEAACRKRGAQQALLRATTSTTKKWKIMQRAANGARPTQLIAEEGCGVLPVVLLFVGYMLALVALLRASDQDASAGAFFHDTSSLLRTLPAARPPHAGLGAAFAALAAGVGAIRAEHAASCARTTRRGWRTRPFPTRTMLMSGRRSARARASHAATASTYRQLFVTHRRIWLQSGRPVLCILGSARAPGQRRLLPPLLAHDGDAQEL